MNNNSSYTNYDYIEGVFATFFLFHLTTYVIRRTFHGDQSSRSGRVSQILIAELFGHQQSETNGTDEHADRHADGIARRGVTHVLPADKNESTTALVCRARAAEHATAAETLSLFQHRQRPTVHGDVLGRRQEIYDEYDVHHHFEVRFSRLGQPVFDVSGHDQQKCH